MVPTKGGPVAQEKFDAALRVVLVRLEAFFRPRLAEAELSAWLGECEEALERVDNVRLPFPEGVAWVALREVGREVTVYIWATAGYEFVRDAIREIREKLGSASSGINRIREQPPPEPAERPGA